MSVQQTDESFVKLVHKIAPGARLLQVRELSGGLSNEVVVFDIALPDGKVKKMVKRGGENVLSHYQKENALENEFHLLNILHQQGYRVPETYCLDTSGELFKPVYFVMAYMEGVPLFKPENLADYIKQSVQQLVHIHQYPSAATRLSFLPELNASLADSQKRRVRLDATLNEIRIGEILEAVWPLPQQHAPTLVHGDFWPGNLLWQDQQLTAILDWEFAAIGDPLFDLATARLEILWQFGAEVMDQFTRQYAAIMTQLDFSQLPYWDLAAAFVRPINECPEMFAESTRVPIEVLRTGHLWFTTQALAKLAG
ncbi:MAG: phosphotransferase [Pseudomonadota bacterium]